MDFRDSLTLTLLSSSLVLWEAPQTELPVTQEVALKRHIPQGDNS